MSSPHDPDELIARLAAEESSAAGPADPTLAPLRAELETIEDQIRQPRPSEPLLEESAYRRAAAQVVELGRELSHATQQLLEQPAAAQSPLGELGQYKLLEKLGEGGMGAVYKAVHTRLKRVVALKVLPKERLQDEQAVARFQREMWAVGTLQHPNIVAAHDAGEIDGMHYLVMELVEGIDLGRLVSERGPLPINAACELIRQAALGLQHAFEHNLVHRDIKPSNLMLAAPANAKAAPMVKILDLGLALLDGNQIDAGELTSTGQVMGTLDYMAPEQGTDTHGVDIRADIYSLGASLYKLLTGRAPFGDPQYNSPIKKLMALANQAPKPVESLRPDCPPELAQLIARMLAKSPDERPTPPDELATALEPFSQGADLQALLKPHDAAQVSTVNRHEHTVRTQHTADDPTFVPSGAVDASAPTRLAAMQASQPPAGSKRRLVLALAGLAAALVMGVVIMVATDRGTVEIKAPDDLAEAIQVKLVRGSKELNPNWQIKPGVANTLTVRSGDIEVQLPGDEKNEYEFVGPTELRVKRGETMVFTLRRKSPTAPLANAELGHPVEEPPPLAEWLKGRKVLTVAQDGSGQFKTIQAALNAVQSGQVVKVLDAGPYRERLELKALSADIGLISESRTIIELVALEPTGIKTGEFDVYLGHNLKDLDGFRLSGLHFVFPDAADLISKTDKFVCAGLEVVHPAGLVVEDCRFEGRCPTLAWDSLTVNFDANSSVKPVCIRDSVIEGGLRFGATAVTFKTLVTRNYLWKLADAPFRPNVKLYDGTFDDLSLRQNIFDGQPNGADIEIDGASKFNHLDITNNTFNSSPPVMFLNSVSTGSVTIRNNLCMRPGVIGFYPVKPEHVERATEGWRLGHNAYPRPLESGVAPGAGDISVREALLSLDRKSRDYLHFPANAASATGGVGGALPRYIGALPPGPTPAGGDWFTRLRHRWLELDSADSPAPQIPEPPPLAEWLKGRKVLTVAQDGSGQFKTIQSALDALQPGEAVKVLDKGPYRERLVMYSVPKDVGLFSEARTVLEMPEWAVSHQEHDAATGKEIQIYQGHRFEGADGFRLNGFEMLFVGRDQKRVRRLVMGKTRSAVLENCRIHGSEDIEGEPVELSDNDWAANDGVGMTACVRDCLLDGTLVLGSHHKRSPPDPDRRSTAIVVRNYFMGTGTDDHLMLGGQSWAKLLIQQNIFAGKSQNDAVLNQIERLGVLDFNSNTLESTNGIVISESVPAGSIAIRNNLRTRGGLIRLLNGAETSSRRPIEEWTIDHNSYPDFPAGTIDQTLVSRAPGDLTSQPRFLSKVPQDADFLRLRLDDPAASAGAGGERPHYIGALPPGPAPQTGDWFTRLRENWGLLTPDKTASPLDVPEPPPLAEWLKGRTVLTVAQDGSGQFKTIQAALNALQTGQVVKVLDKGPYRERLEVEEIPADTGLVASDAILELPDYAHYYAENYKGHLLINMDGFRISGFTFVFPKPVHEFSSGFQTHRAGGFVLDNCWVKASPVDFIVAFHSGGSTRPAWVRECGFEGRLILGSDENPKAVAVATRNLFVGATGSAAVGRNSTFAKFSFHHNLFLDHRHGLIVGGGRGESLDISNNTFACGGPMVFDLSVPDVQVSFRNNLHTHPGLVALNFGAEKQRESALQQWFRATNCYPRELTPDDHWKPEQLLPKGPTDLLMSPVFISKNPADRDYLRLNADDRAAQLGSGGAGPTYIGALPPGPAPAKGDWFTRLREKWLGLPAASSRTEGKPLGFQTPEFESWAKSIAELPPAKQAERVAQKLVELNPGFDGEVEPNIDGGALKGLTFLTDHVTDLSPVRAIRGLQILVATGKTTVKMGPRPIGTGKLSDLSPLKGMQLTILNVSLNPSITDLSPVAELPLKHCFVGFTGVTGLGALSRMKLEDVDFGWTQVSDLSPLKGMPIAYLRFGGTEVADLSPLTGMPLTGLMCNNTLIRQLAPLKGAPLEALECYDTLVSDLSPLKGMPLKRLICSRSPITDVMPLAGMQLEGIAFTPAQVTQGLDIIRGMKSLRTIGIDPQPQWTWPADEFWKKYDAGEFGKP